ncbi:MAG: YlxR family protein [Actinobacteria bacterium]|nr:YlxR family protein [Actinomycetota bacterium]
MTVLPAPIRTCVGCRSRREQSALRRYVRAASGEVRESRSAAGRGAWICADSQNCLDRAFSTRGFDRALGARSFTKNTNFRNRLTMAK